MNNSYEYEVKELGNNKCPECKSDLKSRGRLIDCTRYYCTNHNCNTVITKFCGHKAYFVNTIVKDKKK